MTKKSRVGPISAFSIILAALIFVIGCSTAKLPQSGNHNPRSPATDSIDGPDYPQIFSQVRDLFKPDSGLPRKQQKQLTETKLVEVMQTTPSLATAGKDDLIKTIEQEASVSNDPTKYLRLVPPKGQSGYSNLQIYADHPVLLTAKRKTLLASNLVKVWSDFLNQAQNEIVLNVFDFDLQSIADILVKKAQSGVNVRVGIDKNVIAQRPEVKKVYDYLVAGFVNVTQVNSVGLNHQKMAAIDWDYVDRAKVLFSSGNLTQSCLGPEGDLVNIPAAKRPKESIPNANHVITMDSWLLANLVNHELTKTLDPRFLYRGSQYPTTAAYQVTGPGVDPQTLEPYPDDSLVISFAPGGGNRNINKNIIAHFIKNSSGPVRMIQFAYSSEDVATALRERAQQEFQTNQKFDFKSVGDTPFAMQYWSQFLKMSGLDLVTDQQKNKSYQTTDQNEWLKSLTPDQLSQLRSSIRIAPPIYGTHGALVDGQKYATTSKIHHKVLSTGPFAIVGTSFNFSEGAETNNEQILVFKNKDLVEFVNGMTEWLYRGSTSTVYAEAMRRNKFGVSAAEDSTGSPEDEVEKKSVALPVGGK